MIISHFNSLRRFYSYLKVGNRDTFYIYLIMSAIKFSSRAYQTFDICSMNLHEEPRVSMPLDAFFTQNPTFSARDVRRSPEKRPWVFDGGNVKREMKCMAG